MHDLPDAMIDAACDAWSRTFRGGTLDSHLRHIVQAALHAAPTVDGWVWCDPQDQPWFDEGTHSAVCPGPHRTLIIGPTTGGDL